MIDERSVGIIKVKGSVDRLFDDSGVIVYSETGETASDLANRVRLFDDSGVIVYSETGEAASDLANRVRNKKTQMV